MPTGPAVPMEWSRFHALIADLDKSLDDVIDPTDAWLKQEAIQQILMDMSQAYHATCSQDPQHPHFISMLNTVIKSAAPNPDYMYSSARIEGGGTYRISGVRGTSLFVHIAVGSWILGVDDPGPALGHVDVDDLAIGPDGAFSVILSAEKPAGYEGDWRQLDPRAKSIGVRQAAYDWLNEVDARFAIERLDGPATYRRWPMDEIAGRLEQLAAFHERYSRVFVHFVKTLKQHPVNQVILNTWSDIGGLPEQTYFEGLFEFDEDEALVFETEVPERARYWSVLLADQLFNTIEWEKCQSSLNGHQARLDADGKFRAVISAVDPGVPNWLDTAGRYKGVVQGRWYQSSSAPTPTLKRVKLSDVRAHLPAETPTVNEAERKESLLARFRGAQMRRRW